MGSLHRFKGVLGQTTDWSSIHDLFADLYVYMCGLVWYKVSV